MAGDTGPILYSTDGSHLRKGHVTGRDTRGGPAANTRLNLRLDTKGRAGKAVTVLFGLPPHPTYWGDLLRQLKSHCGTGGSLKEGALELQGDQRDKVQAYLGKLGFAVRRAGG